MRLALTGCGDVAYYVALAAKLNPRISLAACADPSGERRNLFTRRFGIPRSYASQKDMLANERIDGLYLAVPHDLHRPLTAEAAEAGAAVLSEKPLARTAREGAEIIAHLQRHGGRAAVNYQWRYDAKCRALIRSCQEGAVGEIRYIRIYLPWQRKPGYFAVSPWHGSKERAGGGTLLTQGSHPLDIALLAAGSRPLGALGLCRNAVFGESETEDLSFGIVECENGVLIELCSSMVSPPERAAVIEVQGGSGAVCYSGPRVPRLRWHGGKRHLRRRGRPVVSELDPLYCSLEGFRRWTAGGPPHRCTAADALPVLQAVDGVYASALIGEWAEVPKPLSSDPSSGNRSGAPSEPEGRRESGTGREADSDSTQRHTGESRGKSETER